MKTELKTLLREALNKSEVKDEVIKVMNSSDLKAKIDKMVADKLKNNKQLEDKVEEITQDVVATIFKNLWQKKGFWQNG